MSRSPEETMALGERIAASLGPGSVVALRGGLGAGKTCLARGIARGLKVRSEVTSPTYTIICEHEGTLPFYHIDAYRLEGDDDFENTGAGELLFGEGVSVVEWSERVPCSIPPGAFAVDIEIREGDLRLFRISGPKDVSLEHPRD
ncbi:MAG: tRNA (adenosine(37)-N6)-threonylcarbamoyltransferase complex ATPase subunit type 1 TsaE [Treponema sp.]|nr:tRNA (adenosine(37)-N6)-threonylcarbamoyltransferase complex ATPase subunit type 1 TsaE [Treponema sp.]